MKGEKFNKKCEHKSWLFYFSFFCDLTSFSYITTWNLVGKSLVKPAMFLFKRMIIFFLNDFLENKMGSLRKRSKASSRWKMMKDDALFQEAMTDPITQTFGCPLVRLSELVWKCGYEPCHHVEPFQGKLKNSIILELSLATGRYCEAPNITVYKVQFSKFWYFKVRCFKTKRK